MEAIEKIIQTTSRSDVTKLYVIGDVHIGAANCAESHLRRFVAYIEKQPNALWLGGGDYSQCITPSDIRYDNRALSNWIFEGGPLDVKEALTDIPRRECNRFCEIVWPIKDKCLGLIEGNHEFKLMQRYNNGLHYVMCDKLEVPNLTDCAFVRLTFRAGRRSVAIMVWIEHGMGGGRTRGAEPNHLARIESKIDADILLRGHSHSFRIEPPSISLYMPRTGRLPSECMQREIRSANWGSWLLSYVKGPSTYDSRASYPARPLEQLEITIKPHGRQFMQSRGDRVDHNKPLIILQECHYD